MNFTESFIKFLEESGVDYSMPQENLFAFPGKDIKIKLVSVAGFVPFEREDAKTIYLYEDRWNSEQAAVKARILAHLGRFRSIFARNCTVRSLTVPQARAFLARYHSYGSAMSKYRYGLYLKDELVAVASFSRCRPMLRGDVWVHSAEWIRYASLPDTRISGGMGKLLKAFIKDVHPEEVMSYADLEWSDGAVYRILGFEADSFRTPVEFYVDPVSWTRVPVKKAVTSDGLFKISNLGSIKYLKRTI